MLEIIMIIFLGRWIHELAKKYKKPNSWLYPLLAVFTYLIFGYGSAALIMILFINANNEMPSLLVGLLGIPFGAGAIWLLHTLLKRAWSRELGSQDALLDDNSDEL